MMDYSGLGPPKRKLAHRIVYTLMACSLLFVVLVASGCTIVKYEDGDTSLFVADIRITGSAIDLTGTINEVGTLSVNREQGSAEGIINNAVNAATGGVLGELVSP